MEVSQFLEKKILELQPKKRQKIMNIKYALF
jgi:hypothetical protein